MAVRPATLPAWARIRYGGYGSRWDEALSQCRRVLYEWAAAKRPCFYGDLIQFVTAIPWPEGPHTHEGRQLGYLLGQVAISELDPEIDRPLISALAVGKANYRPAEGFWKLLDELGVSVGRSEAERESFWLSELRRCYDSYGGRRD